MTTIGIAGMTNDISPIEATARATGRPQSSTDVRLFAEILENGGLTERRGAPSEAVETPLLRRVELSLGGRSDLQALSDLGEEQQAALLLAHAGPAEPSGLAGFPLTPSAGQVTIMLPILSHPAQPDVASSRAAAAGAPPDGMAHQAATDQSAQDLTVRNLTGSVSALEVGARAGATAQLGAAQLATPTALPTTTAIPTATTMPTAATTATAMPMPIVSPGHVTVPAMGRADRPVAVAGSAQSATISSRTSLSSALHETHLPAVQGSPAAASHRALSDQNGSYAESWTRSDDPRPAAGPGVDGASGNPMAGDVEPLTVQIAGQISAAWASLQGALPVDNAESTLPMATANPLPEMAPDVVKALRFDLHPADLGEVHVRLSMNRNGVKLHLSFSADAATGIAKAEGHELMQAISAGGMTLSQLVIDTISGGRAEPPVRQDGSASHVAMSGGSTADGSGAEREHHGQQEQAQRHPRAEQYASQSRTRSDEKAGIFI